MAPFKSLSFILLFAVTTVACSSGNGNTEQANANQPATEQAPAAEASGEWISLWDGETFNNWTVNENPESFTIDRKSTRLNSSHVAISYAFFCLKKKNNIIACDYHIKSCR